MMEFQKIELYKERNFSEKMNATVEFIRQNFKNLAKNIIYIAGPLILIIAIITVYLRMSLLNSDFDGTNMVAVGFGGLIVSLMSFLASIMVAAVVYSYVKIYNEKSTNEIEVSEVWQNSKKLFFPYILAVIVTGLLSFIGALFFLIPGVYLFITFLLMYSIMANENIGVGEAFGRCFALISGKWWSTFGLVFIIYLLIVIISLVFSIPAAILQEIVGLSSISQIDIADNNRFFEVALMVITVIQNFASYILYAILFVGLAFQYGNLVERKEAVGLMDKIDNLGKKPDDEEVSI